MKALKISDSEGQDEECQKGEMIWRVGEQYGRRERVDGGGIKVGTGD